MGSFELKGPVTVTVTVLFMFSAYFSGYFSNYTVTLSSKSARSAECAQSSSSPFRGTQQVPGMCLRGADPMIAHQTQRETSLRRCE